MIRHWPDGRRRRIRCGGYSIRRAALAVLAALRGPDPADPARAVTTGEWLEHWLASRTSPAASTVRSYAGHMRLYLKPYLGRVLLAELSAAHVQAMFTAITRRQGAAGSPVSAATLSRIRATLRAALNTAIRAGLICDNPASQAELPPARRQRAVVWTPARIERWQCTGERPALAVWTAAQTAHFLRSIKGHRLYGWRWRPAWTRTVQEVLGHSSIVLTADTYTSVLPGVAHAAAEKVASLVLEAGRLIPGTRRRRQRPGPPQE